MSYSAITHASIGVLRQSQLYDDVHHEHGGQHMLNTWMETTLISMVNHYSLHCPAGIESFCIAALVSLMNWFSTFGGIVGSWMLSIYDVKSGNYDMLIYPVGISVCYSVVAVLAAPVLTSFR